VSGQSPSPSGRHRSEPASLEAHSRTLAHPRDGFHEVRRSPSVTLAHSKKSGGTVRKNTRRRGVDQGSRSLHRRVPRVLPGHVLSKLQGHFPQARRRGGYPADRDRDLIVKHPARCEVQTSVRTRSSGRGTCVRSSASTSNWAYRILRRPPLPMKRRSCSSVVRPRHSGCFWSVRKDPRSP
jgi:hypothetical protein